MIGLFYGFFRLFYGDYFDRAAGRFTQLGLRIYTYIDGPLAGEGPVRPHRTHLLRAGPGYEGKRQVWAKEDTERESHGIPDPLAEFTDPLERDSIRARYKWDRVKKTFYTDPNTREFMRLLVIVILPHYHISFQSI